MLFNNQFIDQNEYNKLLSIIGLKEGDHKTNRISNTCFEFYWVDEKGIYVSLHYLMDGCHGSFDLTLDHILQKG